MPTAPAVSDQESDAKVRPCADGSGDQEKRCSRCQRWKLIDPANPDRSLFAPFNRAPDGAQAWCRKCHKVKDRLYWQERKKRDAAGGAPTWASLNPAAKAAHSRERRRRIRDNGGRGLSDVVRDRVLTRYPFCLRCEGTLALTVDHVIPVAQGGIDDETNLQTLCETCNRIKKDKVIDYRPRYLARLSRRADRSRPQEDSV